MAVIRYEMVPDLGKCTGGHLGLIAGQEEKSISLGQGSFWLERIEKRPGPHERKSHLRTSCNNGENPACLNVCLRDARYGNPKVHISKKCLGCDHPMGPPFRPVGIKTGSFGRALSRTSTIPPMKSPDFHPLVRSRRSGLRGGYIPRFFLFGSTGTP